MYEEDARAFAVALYLDHGFSYDEIAFLLRDSRKFMGDRPSGGGGNSQGPVASTIQEWVRLFLDTGDVMPRDANAEGLRDALCSQSLKSRRSRPWSMQTQP